MKNGMVKANKSIQSHESPLYKTQRGFYLKISTMPVFAIEAAQRTVVYPEVPINDGVPNPLNPHYVDAVNKAQQEANDLVLDATCIFAVELVDEKGNKISPPDNNWEKHLERFGVKIGDDDTDPDILDDIREATFIRYMCIGGEEDINEVFRRAGVATGDVQGAMDEKFPGNKEVHPDKQLPVAEQA